MNIEDFENGQPISCDEPPMACRIFPDNCFCRTVEMRKREDGNSSFVPMEKTVKKWNQHKIKSFEQLILRQMRPDQKQIMDNVFNAVSYVTTVGFDDFVSKRRFRWIMNARIPFSHICFNRYCEDGEQSNGCSILTLEVIGEYMRKNHASIINQRKRAKDFLFSDPSFKRKLRDIEDLLLTHEVVLPTDRLLWSSQVDAVFDSAPSGRADAVATQDGK